MLNAILTQLLKVCEAKALFGPSKAELTYRKCHVMMSELPFELQLLYFALDS